MNVDHLLSLGRCTAVAVHPTEPWLAVAVSRLDRRAARYVSDLWRVSVGGGAPSRLTGTDSNDTAPAFGADGSLLFLSNRPIGDEPEDERVVQVWCLPAAGGDARPLTDEALGVESFRIAGNTLATLAAVLPGVAAADQKSTHQDRTRHGPSALSYRAMPVRFWDHWLAPAAPHLVVRNADGSGRRDLTPTADREYRESPWDLAHDGTHVRIARAYRAEDGVRSDVLERWEVGSGSGQEEAWASAPGQAIVAVRCRHGDSPDVAIFERRGGPGAPRVVAVAVRGGVERVWDTIYPREVLLLDACHLLLAGDRDGRLVLEVWDLESDTRRAEAAVGTQEALVARPGDPTTIFGLHHRFTHPPEPFRWQPGSGPVEVVARLSGFKSAVDVEVEEIRVPGAGGDLVHAYVLGARGRQNTPALVWIHGGPIGAYSDGWHWRWNPLVAVDAGYTVCLPNPRGSTGYGWDFVDGVWGNSWGDACFRDVMAVVDEFLLSPRVDPRRVAAMGGSFGGYMVNWIGGQTQRFQALVSHAGVWNFSAFAGVTDEPGWWRLELDGSPWEDLAAFNRWSPAPHAKAWRTPVLITHGERDYRVPVGEALQMFDTLHTLGVKAELLIFPDENHWILKPRNIRAWYQSWIDFLGTHLGPPPAIRSSG